MGARPSSFARPVVEAPPVRTFAWSEEQDAIFQWFEGYGEGHLIVRARAGCLAGDTKIAINRARKGWTLPLNELVAKFSGLDWPAAIRKDRSQAVISRRWDLSFPTFVQHAREGTIRLTRIKNAWASGIKQTFEVLTEKGRCIRATAEHPFMTDQGWLRLDELNEKVQVCVRGSQTNPSSKPKNTYSDESNMWAHPFAVVRPPDRTHPNGTARVPTHRLVVEADRNHVDYHEFLWLIRCGKVADFQFLDPKIWSVHHLDRHPDHNTVSNLEVLTREDHHRLHSSDDTMCNVLFFVGYDRVRHVRLWGEEETYDIEVADGPHNFLANGFVVHNTGKTSTIIEGVDRAPEDAIQVCAFSKLIATTLTNRITNPNVQASTIHGIGMRAIGRRWRGIPVAPRNTRAEYLTSLQVKSGVPRGIQWLVSMLHTKGRDMLPLNPTLEGLIGLAYQFDLTPAPWAAGEYPIEWIARKALAVMEYAANEPPTYDVGVDYADMMYLPLRHDLLSQEFGLVVVDEAQDMTVAQLEIARRICEGRICLVGDDRQAIFGFRGADSGSLDRLKGELSATELGLKTTYRCARAIVARAQRWVPDICAASANPEGRVSAAGFRDCLDTAQPGDYILSRLNALLVGMTLWFLKNRRKAVMRGREIGAGVATLVKQLAGNSSSLTHLLSEVDKWQTKTTTKLAAMGRQDLAVRARDQADIIRILAEDADSPYAILSLCETLFTDDEDATQITLSSVHKAKGLEADKVYVLVDSFYRYGPSLEEDNLSYVATTRAKTELVLVEGGVR